MNGYDHAHHDHHDHRQNCQDHGGGELGALDKHREETPYRSPPPVSLGVMMRWITLLSKGLGEIPVDEVRWIWNYLGFFVVIGAILCVCLCLRTRWNHREVGSLGIPFFRGRP